MPIIIDLGYCAALVAEARSFFARDKQVTRLEVT